MDSKTRSLAEVANQLRSLWHDVPSLSVAETVLSQVTHKILQVLDYTTTEVDVLSVTGLYNKYIREEISFNVFHGEGGYNPDIVVFDAGTISHIINNHIEPTGNRFLPLVSKIHDIRREYASLDGYSHVLDALEDLVTFFAVLVDSSQSQFISFLNKSFNNELRQLPNLHLQLEESNIYLDPDLAQQLSHRLEALFGLTTPVSAQNGGDTSFHGFQSVSAFDSNDANFKNLFYLFLQIASVWFHPSPVDQDFSGVARIMLDVFTQHCGILWYESADFSTLESKIQMLHTFLVNKADDVVLETACHKIFETYDIFPEMGAKTIKITHSQEEAEIGNISSISAVKHEVPDIIHTSEVAEISNMDRHELIHNVSRLLPQLNEFNFDFDDLFVAALRKFSEIISFEETVTDKDYDYLDDLIKVTNKMVAYENDDNEENGGDIYETALQLYHLHQYLAPEMVGQVPGATLFMKYCAFEVKNVTSVLKQTLRNWNHKVLKLGHLSYTLQNTWMPFRAERLCRSVLTSWFGDTQRILKLSDAASDYYNKSLAANVLFSDWVPKVQRVSFMETKEREFQLKKRFTQWRTRLEATRSMEASATNLQTRKVMSLILHTLESKKAHVEMMNQEAMEQQTIYISRERPIILRFYFDTWYDKANSQIEAKFGGLGLVFLRQKLQQLSHKEKIFVYNRFFSILLHRYSLRLKEHQVTASNDKFLLSFFFQSWCQKFRTRYIGSDFDKQRNTTIRRNAFEHWLYMTKLRQKADKVYNEKLIKKLWTRWTLETLSKTFSTTSLNTSSRTSDTLQSSEFVRSQLQVSFKTWILAVKKKQLSEMHKGALLAVFFRHWCSRLAVTGQNYQAAVIQYQLNMVSSKLQKWHNNYVFHLELVHVADVFYLRKFWEIMKTKKTTCQSLQDLQTDYSSRNKYLFKDRVLMKSVLELWRRKKEANFYRIAERKIAYFDQTLRAPNLIRNHFSGWVEAYNRSAYKQIELSHRLEQLEAKSRYKRLFFNRWAGRTAQVVTMYERGEEFQYTVLHKKYMVIWYDRLSKYQHLQEVAQNFVDERDLKIQREVLSDWSMKYIKFMTRNQQSCDLFVKRWESSRMKSIFDLWLYKLAKRRSDHTEDGEEDEANSSFHNGTRNVFLDTSSESIIVNDSPLAFKNRPGSNKKDTQPKVDTNESYLTSPIKSNVPPNTPFTGTNNKEISPSRLQTSLKMKNERIEALRERYSKVRDSATKTSPTKRPGLVKSFTTQSVPPTNVKPYSVLGNVKLSPPKRPQFHSTPKKESLSFTMPSSPRIKEEPGSVSFDGWYSRTTSTTSIPKSGLHNAPAKPIALTAKDISEAKRLRRITPIVIPMSPEENEPRMSPISTIKQRHSSRAVPQERK